MCVELLKAGHGRRRACGPSVLSRAGTPGSPDGLPCTRGQPAQFLSQLEQKWQRKGNRWWGHRVLSPVRWPGNGWRRGVPPLVLRRPLHTCPQSGSNKAGFAGTLPRPPFFLSHKPWPLRPNRLAREHPKVPDMGVVCPQAGAKQRASRKGCSWVLAIKWGRVVRRGLEAASSSTPTRASHRPAEREGPQSQGQWHSTGVGLGCRGHWLA